MNPLWTLQLGLKLKPVDLFFFPFPLTECVFALKSLQGTNREINLMVYRASSVYSQSLRTTKTALLEKKRKKEVNGRRATHRSLAFEFNITVFGCSN